MTRIIARSILTLTLAAGLTSIACGGSAGISPTAPSVGSLGLGTNVGSGAIILGRVTNVSASAALTARVADPTSSIGGAQIVSAASSDAMTVMVTGANTSTTVSPAGDFTLTGVPSGTVQLQFAGRGVNATVTISGVEATDRIEISVALNGSAAKVESENRRRENTNRVEVNGRVTAVGTTTLQVGAVLVTVPPGAVIRHGSRTLTLADIKVGDHVEVKGTRDASGLIASEVKVESDPHDDDGEDGDRNRGDGRKDDDKDDDQEDADELSGAVSSLGAAACPSLSLVIKGVTVTTSAATKFDGITCGSIKVGTSIEVTGTRIGNTLAATKVEAD